MKKKGMEMPVWVTISIIIAILCIVLYVTFVQDLLSKDIFFKQRVAKNLAFELDTVFSVPGNIYLVEKELYNYSVRFYDDRVEVYKEENELDKATYYYVKSGAQRIDSKFNKPSQIVIARANGELIITESVQEVSSILK